MDQAAERYLKRLRRALVCPKRERERLLEDAGDMLENFSQENPGAFYKDYVASFGPPEDFAAQMLSNLDPEDVSEAQARRKRAMLGVALAVLAAAALLAGFWFGRQSKDPPPAETVTPTAEATPTAEPTPAPTPTVEPSPTPTEDGDPFPDLDEVEIAAYLEEQFTDANRIEYRQAVAVVTSLGLFGAKTDGSFDPADTVTRAEAAKLVCFMMRGGSEDTESYVKAEPTFSDIQGNWAESYIEYCADLGIVFDEGDGTFRPDDEITALELIRMGLCALGYDATAYKLNGEDWAVRTDEVARLSIPSFYDGLNGVVVSAPVTREVAAQLIYNALRMTPKMVVPIHNPVDGTIAWQYTDASRKDGSPDTLLHQRFNMEWTDITLD